MRSRLTSIAKGSAIVHGLGRVLDRVVTSGDHVCTALTFHRIDTYEPDLYPGLASLAADEFERFMDGIADDFHPIGVDRLVDAMADGRPLPARSLLVTFDDAYRDFSEVAWPIMRDRGIPVVLFVPTAYPDHPERSFWWDELYSAIADSDPSLWPEAGITASDPIEAFKSVRGRIKSQPHDQATETLREMLTELGRPAGDPAHRDRVLGWDELAGLADDGVTLAPHSRTHPMLDRLDDDRLDGEIRGSYDDMCERLGPGRVERVFAYPSGGHDPRVRDAVRRAGYAVAFTTERGVIDVGHSSPDRLPRLNVGRDASVGAVRTEAAIRRAPTWVRSARRSRPR